MKKLHLTMFNRAFERNLSDLLAVGLSPDRARELAADAAWAEYERYCEEKLDQLREEGKR